MSRFAPIVHDQDMVLQEQRYCKDILKIPGPIDTERFVPKDKIGLIGKFSYGKHVLYDNEWGIELTHLIYFDDKLGEKRYLNLNYADEEKIKGWLEDLKSGKALGKGLERGVKSAF